MATVTTWIDCYLNQPVKVRYLHGNLFTSDNNAHVVGVKVYSSADTPASLSGAVSADIVRSDGVTVTQSGTLSGNQCSVAVPAAAYAEPGTVIIAIKLTSSSVVTTLGVFACEIYDTSSGSIVDPGTVIPDIEALIIAIDRAVASIPADYSALWTTLAPAFSDSTNYVAGQYVTRNGVLYRFTSNHSSGSWTGTDAVQVNVGGEITGLKSAIKGQYNGAADTSIWGSGGISPTTGTNNSNTTTIRTNKISTGIVWIEPKDGYKFAIYAYDTTDNDKYVGYWNGSGFAKTSSSTWFTDFVSLFALAHKEYRYRICAKNTAGTNISTSDATNIILYTYTDTDLNKIGIAADAKATGDKISEIYSSLTNGLFGSFVEREWNPNPTLGYYLNNAEGIRTENGKYAYTATWNGYGYFVAVKMTNPTYVYWLSFYDETGDIYTGAGYLGHTSSGEEEQFIPDTAKLFGLSFRRADNANLTASDVTNFKAALKAYIVTDKTLSMNGLSADSKTVGDRFNAIELTVNGGNIEYNKAQVDALTSVYSGKQIRIDIGKTLENAHKNNNNVIRNYIVSIPVNTSTIIFNAYHTDMNFGSVFLDKNDTIIEGCANHDVTGKEITMVVPQGAVKFVYSISTAWDDYSLELISNGIFPIQSIPMDLHTMPQSIGVLNAIKRARQITDIVWTPAMDIPRTSLLWGGSEHQYFEDVFTSGKEYKGIPYCDFLTDYSRVIGLSRPIDVFVTSVCNALTAEGQESEYSERSASYYGCACTGLTAYALGLPYTYSTYYANIEGMVLKFKLIDSGVRHTLKDIRLGDVVQVNGHCALITDIIYSDDNEVAFIEISEESRDGNPNKNVLGSQYGGKARRFTMTPDEFYDYYADFSIMRYDYIDNVQYTSNPYVPMQDEGNRIRLLNMPIIPYYGNKCMLDGGASCKLLIASTGYTHLIVKKNGTAWNENGTTDPYDVTGLTEINISCDSDEAVYTAFLATYQNGTIKYKTDSCVWYVKGSITVTATASNGSVSFEVKTVREELLPWFANIKRTDTVRGYNHMIFDDYEHTETGGYHVYTFSVDYTGTAPTNYIIGLRSDNFGAVYLTGSVG